MTNRTSLYMRTDEQLEALSRLASDLDGAADGQRGASRNVLIQKIADAYERNELTTLRLIDAVMLIADGEDVGKRYGFTVKIDNLERVIF